MSEVFVAAVVVLGSVGFECGVVGFVCESVGFVGFVGSVGSVGSVGFAGFDCVVTKRQEMLQRWEVRQDN